MKKLFLAFLLLCVCLSGCGSDKGNGGDAGVSLPASPVSREHGDAGKPQADAVSLETIPAYSGAAYVAVNGNVPFFDDSELVTEAFEKYSSLDTLGRCGAAYANICREIMPTQERGSIGSVKPTGWHLVKYDVVEGNYLYNRCHLIAYQLAGENANEQNLITGTRYLNIAGMSPFEDRVADYVKETGNHVLYRATPVFEGDNLLANGVLLEAKSVEDGGDGISFNVFCYNVQPGIVIDYATGDNRLAEGGGIPAGNSPDRASGNIAYVLNTNTQKFHYPDCASVKEIKDDNRREVAWGRDECIAGGYAPCKICKP